MAEETTPQRILETRHGRFLIRPYQPGDEEHILPVWRLVFGKEMTLEEWRWKYPASPAGFRCLLCLNEKGEVVVHYAAQVVRVACQGESIFGLHLTDSLSHPGYRWAIGGKRGLFFLTAATFLRTYLEEIDLPVKPLATDLPRASFHYGFPGERHARLGALLLKYRRHAPGLLYLKASSGGRLRWFRKLEPLLPGRDGELLTRFWQAFEARYQPFCVVRDGPYLSWRFRRPGKDYRFFGIKTFWCKNIKAWLVFTPEEPGRFRILDFLALEEEDLRDLLLALRGEFGGEWEVWLAGNHPLRRAFEAAGFREEPEPLWIIPNTACDFAGGRPPVDFADRFFFTMADADLF